MDEPTIFRLSPEYGEELRPSDLFGSRTLLINDHSFPDADAALRLDDDQKSIVSIQYLEEYLRFLELVCWNENFVIGLFPLPT